VTTSVKAKAIKFLHESNIVMAVLWSLTCAAVILPLLQENNLSNSIPHRIKCRTKALIHLSRPLETWKMLQIILSKLNFIN